MYSKRVVDFVDVTFDSDIAASSFRAGDVSLSGPAGTVSVGHLYLLSGRTYRIPFSPQRANGDYQLVVSPNVLDVAGNPMDQNNSGTPGEDNGRLLREWDQHPDYDDYWRAEDCSLHFAKMNVPCFTIGSWYDFMVQGSVDSFVGRQHQGGANSKGHQQLLLGPWLHGRLNKTNKVGDLVYPENANWPELDHMVRWFDHWLKGVDNGVEQEPAVRYYVMGATGEPGAPGNEWRTATDWPPAVKPTSYYLDNAGGLKPQPPSAPSSGTSYDCDPLEPMEIPGHAFPGAKDARLFEQQKDVRTWTTDPLTQPLEVTGEIKAEIWVKSTVTDSDFILRVSDVYPDGRSILLMDYPQRARYRQGFDHQILLEPGKPAKIAWHIGWTSIVLNRGHRLRVTISSTGAPLYEPNNQTGGPQSADWMKETKRGTHTILHDPEHASRVLLPVIFQP